MKERIYLNLPSETGGSFFLTPDRFAKTKEELQEFVSNEIDINTLEFARRVMFSHELKANNLVEGYLDEFTLIESIMKRYRSIKDSKQKARIMNLHKAYTYILNHRRIDKNTLRTLYGILSKGLLETCDLSRMGEYYRTGKVYILRNGRLDLELNEGTQVENIEPLMEKYFELLNSPSLNDSTEEYIKSQILHFYFVYIHPFFDVNGRTSRTLAMWYLLNKEAYPYIIFNRGITFKDNIYSKAIRDAVTFQDLSYFIEFMLSTVKLELEKEYIVQSIASSTNEKLSGLDYQTLLLFLSMNGLKTVKDFTSIYNRFNDKMSTKRVYEEMIVPLLDMHILEIERTTKKSIDSEIPNMVLRLNKKKVDNNPDKIKRLKL